MSLPKTFGVWGNIEKDAFWDILPEIIRWAESKNIELFLTEKILSDTRANKFNQPIIDSKNKISELDFMLVLGGDGTFLSCARAVEHRGTPILGIHLGDLGFLAKVTLENIFQRLDQVAEGKFSVEKRSMVKASILKNGSSLTQYGLNDFVVSNGESHRMLTAEVYVDDNRVSEYKADGLIIATPTGSTAYSLSSGGPIISPDVDSFVITPISAHTLNSRPLVVSAKSTIKINFSSYNQNIMFITDGQLHELLSPDDTVLITNSDFEIGLIDFSDNDYFQTLRTKMGWGTRGISN
ncbi:MAG: NAD(+)/NADH kinase [Candidatus Neomarinimicrobiota bacterium]|nr:NAD(+)/NADH kinase [Candidatus Neomarinimicrobiota bacterium]|tara:strand:- start:212 stop:1096 length:885 start_codon:yes stop_codon:yes gene_type:complete